VLKADIAAKFDAADSRFWEPIVFQMISGAEIPMETNNDQIVETAVEARAGFLGRPVLLVLIVSCALAVAVMVLTYVGVVKF
jgi:hypothetical protein